MKKKRRKKPRVRAPNKAGPYVVVSTPQPASPGVLVGWGLRNLPSADWGVLFTLTMPKCLWGVYSNDEPGRLLYSNLPSYYNNIGRNRN